MAQSYSEALAEQMSSIGGSKSERMAEAQRKIDELNYSHDLYV